MNFFSKKIAAVVVVLTGFLPGFYAPTGQLTPPAVGYFDFTPAARDAYGKVLNLRFQEARVALDGLSRSEPDNLIRLFVEDFLDFLTAFADNDEASYRRLSRNLKPRLAQIERGEPRSPWKRYCQATMRLHWAVLRGQNDDMLAALNDFNQAYGLLEENQRLFPDFTANKMSLGILHAAIGNTPDEYKWAVRTFGGMQGSAEQGRRELEEVVHYARNNDFVFAEEALTAYAFVQLYLANDEAGAWAAIRSDPRFNPRDNPLAAFVIASIGKRAGHNDEAIRLLEQSPRGGAFYPFHYLDYQLGGCKLCRLDRDANQPLQRFLQNFKGQNGIKEAYQKLAWHHLLQGNEDGYQTYMAYVKIKGAARTEPDKAALREANSGEMPDPRLLRARLLFDGGYYPRAYELLHNAAGDYAANRQLSLEYSYRLGRITHRLGKTTEAVRLYTQTIANGATESWHFACNAALQLGDLQAARGDYAGARKAYEQCLSLHPADYAASLHARAKAGLNRIKGK